MQLPHAYGDEGYTFPNAAADSLLLFALPHSPTRKSRSFDFRPSESSDEKEGKSQVQSSERGFDCRLEILGQAWRAIDPAQGSLHDPPFRQDDKPRDLFVGAFDDRDGNAARLVNGPLRLVALITAVDKGHGHPRALAMHGAKQRRQGVTILSAGGGDLTFDRQACRIDGDMSFAALDFLARVETAWAARFCRLDRLAIDNDGRRLGLAALRLARGYCEYGEDLRPQSTVPPSAKICSERS